MLWVLYGVVYFTTTQRRNNAGRRLDNYVSGSGWQPYLWPALLNVDPTWVAGRSDVTGTADNGSAVPGLRFCYYHTDEAAARSAMDDIVQNWARYEDTNSYWGYVAIPPGG